jgi:hypothetical protein
MDTCDIQTNLNLNFSDKWNNWQGTGQSIARDIARGSAGVKIIKLFISVYDAMTKLSWSVHYSHLFKLV